MPCISLRSMGGTGSPRTALHFAALNGRDRPQKALHFASLNGRDRPPIERSEMQGHSRNPYRCDWEVASS